MAAIETTGAEAGVTLLAHQIPLELSAGATAWILTSAALVLLMTLPGLALFYGGMVREKNVINAVSKAFVICCVVTLTWVIAGYAIAFGTHADAGINAFLGGFDAAFLNGVTAETAHSATAELPEYLWIVYQLTFAIITVAIITGGFAERLKFSAVIVFAALWSLLVYAPVAHWVWGGGFLGADGALDFAGGTVVHINSGVAGLVAALMVGRRAGFPQEPMPPHNLIYTMIGASLLWVGWFGFNAGSAWAANADASLAFLNTQIAAAIGALVWMGLEWRQRGKPGLLGLASGAIGGLVAITPAAGLVTPQAALLIGALGGFAGYAGAVLLKRALRYDDSLDAFGIHGVAGIVGALLTGVFAQGDGVSMAAQVGKQAFAVIVTMAYSAVATFAILMLCKYTVGLRVSPEAEAEGLDLTLHGETVGR